MRDMTACGFNYRGGEERGALCQSSIVSHSHCAQAPLCLSFTVFHSQCIPAPWDWDLPELVHSEIGT